MSPSNIKISLPGESLWALPTGARDGLLRQARLRNDSIHGAPWNAEVWINDRDEVVRPGALVRAAQDHVEHTRYVFRLEEQVTKLRRLLAGLLTVLAVVVALALAGCKRTPDVPDAIDAVNKTLAGVDLAVQASKPVVDGATDVMMQRCAGEAPGDARRACMGALGRPVAPAYERAGAAYDAAVKALEDLQAAWDELQPALAAAREVAP